MQSLNILTNIRPCTGNSSLFSSSGLKSFFGDTNGRTYKVYQCQNIMQLKLRDHISQCKDVASFFPQVVAFFEDDLLIVEEFIEGETSTPKDNIKQHIKNLIKNLQKIMFAETWDYLEYIHKRINLDYKKLSVEPRINHNDLTYNNIIINKFNQPIIVDNEFLACNNGWFMNSFNSNIIDIDRTSIPVSDKIFKRLCQIRNTFTK